MQRATAGSCVPAGGEPCLAAGRDWGDLGVSAGGVHEGAADAAAVLAVEAACQKEMVVDLQGHSLNMNNIANTLNIAKGCSCQLSEGCSCQGMQLMRARNKLCIHLYDCKYGDARCCLAANVLLKLRCCNLKVCVLCTAANLLLHATYRNVHHAEACTCSEDVK